MTFKKNKNCVLKFTNLRKDFLEFLIKNLFEDKRRDFEENFNITEIENDFKNLLKFLNLDEDLNHNFSIDSEFLRELDFINYYFHDDIYYDIKNIFKLLKDLKVFNKTEVQEFLKKYLSDFNEENEEEEEEEEFINEDILNHLEILLDYYDQPLMTEFLDVFPSNKEKINALKSTVKYCLIEYSKIYFNNKIIKSIRDFIKNNLDKDFNFEKEIEDNKDYKYFDVFLMIFEGKNYYLYQPIDSLHYCFYIRDLMNILTYLKNYDKDKFSDFLEKIKVYKFINQYL